METRHIVAAAMLVSLLNGLFSPFVPIAWRVVPFLFPVLAEAGQGVVVMAGGMALAVTTLVVSGVPAAIYERVTGAANTPASAWVWLAGAVFLSLPTIFAFAATLSRS
jgi:hypothetical protein